MFVTISKYNNMILENERLNDKISQLEEIICNYKHDYVLIDESNIYDELTNMFESLYTYKCRKCKKFYYTKHKLQVGE